MTDVKIGTCVCDVKCGFVLNGIEMPGPVAVVSCSVLYLFFHALFLTVAQTRCTHLESVSLKEISPGTMINESHHPNYRSKLNKIMVQGRRLLSAPLKFVYIQSVIFIKHFIGFPALSFN